MTFFNFRVSIILVGLFCVIYAKKPGFEVFLTEKGLKLLETFCERTIHKKLEADEGYQIKGSSGSVDYDLKDVQIVNYNKAFHANFIFSPGEGIAIEINDMHLRVKSPYKVKVWLFYNTGRVVVEVNEMHVKAMLSTRRTGTNGRMEPYISKCESEISSVSVRFIGGFVNQIMNLFDGKIAGKIKSGLKSKICNLISKNFINELQDALDGIPVDIHMLETYFLDVALIGDPVIHKKRAELLNNGEIYSRRDTPAGVETSRGSSPFEPMGFDTGLEDDQKMLYMHISNYTINTLVYQFKNAGKFTFEFNKNTLSDDVAGYLQTDCALWEILCAGNLVYDVAKAYPNSTFEFKVDLVGYPIASILPGFVNITTLVNFTGLVRSNADPSADPSYVFHSYMDGFVFLQDFKLEDYTITGVLKFDSIATKEVFSPFKSVDKALIHMLANYATQDLIEPELAKLISGGIHLPKTGPFNMVDGNVTFTRDVMTIGIDFAL